MSAERGASEAEIQRGIVKWLKKHGCAVYSTSQGYRPRGGTRVTVGFPDLLVMAPDYGGNRWTFAEVKNAKGRLLPAQVQFRDESAKAGVPWELWRSVDDAKRWAVAVGVVRVSE